MLCGAGGTWRVRCPPCGGALCVFPLRPDDLLCFCCGSLYDSPFSFLFLALSEDSSDEDGAEDDGDDEGGGDEFACVQFGSRYQEWSLVPACASALRD